MDLELTLLRLMGEDYLAISVFGEEHFPDSVAVGCEITTTLSDPPREDSTEY